jgi:hypothetical protein
MAEITEECTETADYKARVTDYETNFKDRLMDFTKYPDPFSY